MRLEGTPREKVRGIESLGQLEVGERNLPSLFVFSIEADPSAQDFFIDRNHNPRASPWDDRGLIAEYVLDLGVSGYTNAIAWLKI